MFALLKEERRQGAENPVFDFVGGEKNITYFAFKTLLIA